MKDRLRGWHMFKKLTVPAVFLMFVFPAPVVKADVIYFEDGRVLKVYRAAEKEGQVQFTLQKNGQLYKVDRDLVKKIRKTRKSARSR